MVVTCVASRGQFYTIYTCCFFSLSWAGKMPGPFYAQHTAAITNSKEGNRSNTDKSNGLMLMKCCIYNVYKIFTKCINNVKYYKI